MLLSPSGVKFDREVINLTKVETPNVNFFEEKKEKAHSALKFLDENLLMPGSVSSRKIS